MHEGIDTHPAKQILSLFLSIEPLHLSLSLSTLLIGFLVITLTDPLCVVYVLIFSKSKHLKPCCFLFSECLIMLSCVHNSGGAGWEGSLWVLTASIHSHSQARTFLTCSEFRIHLCVNLSESPTEGFLCVETRVKTEIVLKKI